MIACGLRCGHADHEGRCPVAGCECEVPSPAAVEAARLELAAANVGREMQPVPWSCRCEGFSPRERAAGETCPFCLSRIDDAQGAWAHV